MLLVIITVIGSISTAGTILDTGNAQDPIVEQLNEEKLPEPQKDVKISKKELLEKERLEKKKMLEEKAVKYFSDIGMENEQPECNKNLLTLFGIENEIDKPLYSTAEEKKYCRRNEVTCCSHAGIERTRAHYYKGVSEMRKTLEMLEELFIMFKGPAFDVVIDKIKDVEATKCDYVFEDLHIVKSDFVNPSKLAERTDILGSLLVDLEIYVKRQQWFFANTICTICNPLNHKHFELGDNTKIITHVTTCSEVLEIKDFEIRVAEIFDSFINPYLNLVQCLEFYKENDSNEDENNEEEQKKDDGAKDQITSDNEAHDDTNNITKTDEATQTLQAEERIIAPLIQTQKTLLEGGLNTHNAVDQVQIDQKLKNNLDGSINQAIKKLNADPLLEPGLSLNTASDVTVLNSSQQDVQEKPLDVVEARDNADNIEINAEDKQGLEEGFDTNQQKTDESVPIKKKKRPELIHSIKMDDINKMKKIVTKCYHQKFNVANDECMNICKKDFNNFRFPIEFFDKVGQALKIIFKFLTEKDINEFYMSTKEREFKEADNDKSIGFYNFNQELYEKFNFGNIEWVYKNDNGITIFADHMSKKYVNKHAVVIVVSIWMMIKGFF